MALGLFLIGRYLPSGKVMNLEVPYDDSSIFLTYLKYLKVLSGSTFETYRFTNTSLQNISFESVYNFDALQDSSLTSIYNYLPIDIEYNFIRTGNSIDPIAFSLDTTIKFAKLTSSNLSSKIN